MTDWGAHADSPLIYFIISQFHNCIVINVSYSMILHVIIVLLSLCSSNQAYFSGLKTANVARVSDAKIIKNIEQEIVKSKTADKQW